MLGTNLGSSGWAARRKAQGPRAHRHTWEARNVKHAELSLQRKKCIYDLFSTLLKRLTTDMVNSLVTSVISVVRPPLAPHTMFILDSFSLDLDSCFSVNGTYLYRRCYMYFTNGAEVLNNLVTSYGQAIQILLFIKLAKLGIWVSPGQGDQQVKPHECLARGQNNWWLWDSILQSCLVASSPTLYPQQWLLIHTWHLGSLNQSHKDRNKHSWKNSHQLKAITSK